MNQINAIEGIIQAIENLAERVDTNFKMIKGLKDISNDQIKILKNQQEEIEHISRTVKNMLR